MTFDQITKFALAELALAQKTFKKNPNAQNWQLTVSAMLVWQQAEQLGRAGRGDKRDALVATLADKPMGGWSEAIVKAMSGQTIEEALTA